MDSKYNFIENCRECIYGYNCPCQWSQGCAACLVIQKRLEDIINEVKDKVNSNEEN